MGVVDPTPLIVERYLAEVESLRRQFGEPLTWPERWQLRRKIRKLKRLYFGKLPHVTKW
jgi:hypothetical protein